MTLCDMTPRRYFDERGDAPDGPLVAYMPVNIRTDGDNADGNLISLLQVKLASSHRDPVTTLKEVQKSIVSAREIYSGASRHAVQYYGLIVARTVISDLLVLTSYLDDAFGELARAAGVPTRLKPAEGGR
jgi:hypothetical protein